MKDEIDRIFMQIAVSNQHFWITIRVRVRIRVKWDIRDIWVRVRVTVRVRVRIRLGKDEIDRIFRQIVT
jgi:hypothetical protein